MELTTDEMLQQAEHTPDWDMQRQRMFLAKLSGKQMTQENALRLQGLTSRYQDRVAVCMGYQHQKIIRQDGK